MDMMAMARALTAHTVSRQQMLARNVANADTPGYRAQDLGGFAQMVESRGRTPAVPMLATRPGHRTGLGWDLSERQVDAGGEAAPNGNTVSLEDEMFRQADIRREHQLALTIYDSGLRLTRGALGRR